jgi:hypothetical protein
MKQTLDKIIKFLIPKLKEKKYKIYNCLGKPHYKPESKMTKKDILDTSREYARIFINLQKPRDDDTSSLANTLRRIEQRGIKDPTNLKIKQVKFKKEFDINTEYEKIFGENGILKNMNWQKAIEKGAAELGWRGTYDTHEVNWIYHSRGPECIINKKGKKPTLEELGLKPGTKSTETRIPYKKSRRRQKERPSITPYLR